jgi:hypothetical protein
MPDILLVKVRFLHIGELIEQILLFINCHLQVLAHCKPMRCQILHYCVRPNLKQKYTRGNLLHCNCVCWLLLLLLKVNYLSVLLKILVSSHRTDTLHLPRPQQLTCDLVTLLKINTSKLNMIIVF